MRGLFGALASGLERKATDASALTWSALFGEPSSKAGVSVNIDTALKVSTVLACARVLANGIAQVPLKVYREASDDSKSPAKDHPAYKLLWRRPNEWMTSFEFRRLLMFHAVLTGDAYAYIGRGGTKRAVYELIPLAPGRCRACQAPDYTVTYEISDANGVIETLPRESVLHIQGPSWTGIRGLDAIQVAREAIGLAIATEESHSKLHANGARPGGLISTEGKLGDTARQRLKASLSENVEGLRNAFKTLVLDQKATWTPFSMSGVDSQHLETRRFQIEEICRDLGVFPQMVGYSDKTATFASAEAFFLAHVMHSLAPWVENWEQVFARDLFPDEDDIIAKFSMQGLMRGDAKSRAEFYASGIQNGWLVRNDARRLEDMNPLDGLDEPLIPQNMATQADQAAMAKDLAKVVKSCLIGHNGGPALDDDDLELKIGRVLSTANERRIIKARDELTSVLDTLPAPSGGNA